MVRVKVVAGNWPTSVSRGEGYTLVGICRFTQAGRGGGGGGMGEG